MSSEESQPIHSQSRQQRTVKIVRQRSGSRATMISLGLAGAAAVAVPLIWALSREDLPPPKKQRTIEDSTLDWRCDAGHTFAAPGRTGRRVCQYCDEMASPVTRYACPIHGAKDVEVQFVETEDGVSEIARFRLVGRDWVSADQKLRCPQCNRPLNYDAAKSLRHKLLQRQREGD